MVSRIPNTKFKILKTSPPNNDDEFPLNTIKVVVNAKTVLMMDIEIIALLGRLKEPPRYLPTVSQILNKNGINM